MNILSKWFMVYAGKVLLIAHFVLFMSATLLLPTLYAFPIDKTSSANSQSTQNLPPGSVPAIVKSLLKDLPEEYQLLENSKGYTMSNPGHGLHIAFSPDGLQVKSGSWNWGMTMSGIGLPDSVKPVQKATLKNDAGRMVYDRGDVSEWYVNSPWGVEQGFTIKKAPGEKDRSSLVLELSLSGDLEPSLHADTLVLSDVYGNSIVKYSGLQAFDADNKALPAQLTLAGSTLRIHVDSREARYPVTIDPFIQNAKLTASDGAAGDWFGLSVAISGDTVVIGTYNNSITPVYVFTKLSSGWTDMTQTAKLTASDGTAGDFFGSSVAISGDTIVVGAKFDNSSTGSAYVFTKPGSGWTDMTQTAKLTASDGEAGDWFGFSVGISGDTVVAGATNHNSFTGSAYVFTKPGSGWADMTQTAKLTASDGEGDPIGGGDQFGYSVAISGETVVVGAILDDGPAADSGSAYIFTKPGSGWVDMTQSAKLTANDSEALDYFGATVSISGDTIVVGAYGDNTSTGSAYVFAKPGSGWANMTQTAKLTASDGSIVDRLGYSLAISGDMIVVGALVGDENSTGYAYVFRKPGRDWVDMTETLKLATIDKAIYNYFGASVAINSDTIVVGAYGENSFTGAAYIFGIYNNNFPWQIFLPAMSKNSTH
ncbi:MAG: hypothetical protein C4563_06890 [Desulfobulbus sp.]|nr:MAG: hypothetical protein C4563_06890 [Desulfobulbus sp.]